MVEILKNEKDLRTIRELSENYQRTIRELSENCLRTI